MNANIKKLVEAALKKREQMYPDGDQTNAFRLIHGSGDGFDGLTVDRLGDCVLIEQHRKDSPFQPLLDELTKQLSADISFWVKQRWNTSAGQHATFCPEGPEQLSPSPLIASQIVVEHGLKFELNLCQGEHVGLFLDARPVRRIVRELAQAKRVLNLFCYTSGFGVYAAAGGAKSVTNLDNKRSALERSKINFQLNNLSADQRTFLKDDAFRFLSRQKKGKGRFDLIIVDPPPKFKKANKKLFVAQTGYEGLLVHCLNVLDQNGILLAGLNALTVDDAVFIQFITGAATKAEREIKIKQIIGPDADFPKDPNRPTARFALVEVL